MKVQLDNTTVRLILIDGEQGEVVVHPTAVDLSRYRAWQRETAQKGKRLALLRDAETLTRDGTPIALHANAESTGDVAQAHRQAA